MAIFRKRKEISNQLHKDKRINQIYHLGKKYLIEWLSYTTSQSIVAAFGAEEGKSVIKATNDYLNAIALTDTGRAQQLAGFINEDPLLVTSLVETSKVRYCDGVCKIESSILANTNDKIQIKFYNYDVSVDNGIIGVEPRISGQTYFRLLHYSSRWLLDNFNDVGGRIQGGTAVANKWYEVEVGNRYVKDLTTNTNIISGSTLTQERAKCHYVLQNNSTYGGRYTYLKVLDKNGNEKGHLLPYNNGTESGMLDILSGTFHPNANNQGAFTIQLTDKE